MAHTPAPWKVHKRSNQTGLKRILIVGGGPNHILAEAGTPHLPAAENDANACLMAAAPEMLEALKDALGPLEEGQYYDGEVLEVLASVREAIEKAEGR